jgi:hypothetical protein
MAKMNPYRKAVAKTGTYKARDGSEKSRYVNVGTLFQYEDGGLCLKLDSVPVGEGWNGFISFFEIDQKDGQQRKPEASQSGGYDLNDDVPF